MFRRNRQPGFRRRRRKFSEIWHDHKRERANRKKLRREIAFMRKRVRKEIVNDQKIALRKFLKNPFGRKKLSHEEKILKKHLRNDIVEYRKKAIINSPHVIYQNLINYLGYKKDELMRIRKRFDYSIAPFVKRENSRELRADMLKNLLNSTVTFITAFWLVYLVGQVATVLTAQYYSIPSTLHSYITDWPLYDYSPLYTRRNLIVIFGSGPLLCAAIAVTLLALFKRIKKHQGLKLFITWVIFHGFNMFFAAYISGVITRTGLVYSSAWLFLSQPYDIEEIIFMLSAVIVLLSLGFIITRNFLKSSASERIINPYIRIYYMLSTVLLPFVFGSLVIHFTNFPKNPLNFTLLQGFSLLMVLPTLIHYNSPVNQQVKLTVKAGPVPVAWKFVFFFILVTVIVRMIIYPGIQFS